jgi:HEAT repeat protein
MRTNDGPLASQTHVTGGDKVLSDGSSIQIIQADRGNAISDVIQAVVSGQVTGDLHIGDKIYTRSDLEELDDYLARAIAAYEARMYQLVARPPVPPDQPYKFLYAFEIEDADIFFGRDAASQALHQTVLRDLLTVLHAKSGAGKTSILNAGLSPRLIREGRLPVYARAYDDPVRAIKRAIAPPSLGPWPELLPQLTLHEFLGLACAHLSRQTQELVVVLDQFEEFFIFWPERDHRLPLIDALADCYDDKSLAVRFILALRKDYYSDLATFQDRLPHIFHNEFYLESVTRQEAQAAITGPVAELGYPVSYEPVLLDVLLDDLARGGMELPHLQIICTELYEALAEGETAITLSSYEELGRAEGLLSGYLNSVLARMPGYGSAIAREVLKELVSSEATKRVLSYGVLVTRIEAERAELDDVLTRLVNARLLRRDEVAGQITYEMAHEYLIQEIIKWIDQSDLEFKRAEELLAREVANWRVHGTLIPGDRLKLLHSHRRRFKELDDGVLQCLLLSALQANSAPEDWSELAGEKAEKLLLVALNDPRSEVRWVATYGLGLLWGLPEVSRLGSGDSNSRRAAAGVLGKRGDLRAVRPLLSAMQDEDDVVRRLVAKALVNMGEPVVEPLIDALGDKDWRIRLTAAKVLGNLGDPRAVEPLIIALGDKTKRVREAAAWALGRLGDHRALVPLTTALRDEDSGMRHAAAGALGGLGDLSAADSLISALREKDWYLRQTAAAVFGKLGDLRAVKPLINALQDENGHVRCMAARALGNLDDPQAVEPLIIALRDEDNSVRQVAAEALGRLCDPRAEEPLNATLRDKVEAVRQSAAEALKKIGVPKALAALEDWQQEQPEARLH